MKGIFWFVLLGLACLGVLTGCDGVKIESEPACIDGKCPVEWKEPKAARARPVEFQSFVNAAVPYCDIPMEWRERNYDGGSCVHASMETVLRWQGQFEMATWWRATYSEGEYASRMHERLDAAGLKFAFTQSRGPDGVAFLEKCCALRLCAAVNIPDGHMQTIVGMDSNYCYIVDNNGSGEVKSMPRADFFRGWTGWAVTVVGNAPPPDPFL